MGIFDKLTSEERSLDFESWLISGGLRPPSVAGIDVDEKTALSSPGIWRAVRLLSSAIGSAPLHLLEVGTDRGRKKARNHPTYRLLHDSPNPELTPMEFREMLQANVEVSGNGFAEIVWRGGYPIELWPLWSGRMTVERKGGRLLYHYRLPDGQTKTLSPMNVLHVRGFSTGGLLGINPIEKSRDSISVGLALQGFAGRFFSNGANPGVVLKHPGKLSKDARDAMRDEFERESGGLNNAWRPLILQQGLDWEQRGISPEQSQAIESRKFQIDEVARITDVAPHLLFELDRATFNNVEHISLEHVRDAVRPRAVRFEQRLEKSILTENDRKRYIVRFNLDGLLRGDLKSRYESYSIGRQNGWLSANDVREKEDMNPIEGDGGDDYHIQLNMVPLDMSRDVAEPSESEPSPEEPPPEEPSRTELRAQRAATNRQRQEKAHRTILQDVGQRMLNGECSRLRREIEKHLTLRSARTLENWLTEFYRDWPKDIARAFLPALRAYAEIIAGAVQEEVGGDTTPELDEYLQDYADTLGVRWSASSRSQLMKILRETPQDEVQEALTAKVDQWQAERAEREARHESNRAGNAFAKFAYGLLGVSVLRWVTLGDSCPWCQKLNGRTVAIQGFFLDAGAEVDGGEKGMMKTRRRLSHPPLHKGCDCQVVAGI